MTGGGGGERQFERGRRARPSSTGGMAPLCQHSPHAGAQPAHMHIPGSRALPTGHVPAAQLHVVDASGGRCAKSRAAAAMAPACTSAKPLRHGLAPCQPPRLPPRFQQARTCNVVSGAIGRGAAVAWGLGRIDEPGGGPLNRNLLHREAGLPPAAIGVAVVAAAVDAGQEQQAILPLPRVGVKHAVACGEVGWWWCRVSDVERCAVPPAINCRCDPCSRRATSPTCGQDSARPHQRGAAPREQEANGLPWRVMPATREAGAQLGHAWAGVAACSARPRLRQPAPASQAPFLLTCQFHGGRPCPKS